VFAPIHWTAQVAGRARVDAVVAGHVDPVSGQPELKATPVAVKQFPAAWYGFAVSQSKPVVREVEYWAVAPATNGWRVELAGAELNGDWDATARTLLNLPATADLLSLRDRTAGHFRCAGSMASDCSVPCSSHSIPSRFPARGLPPSSVTISTACMNGLPY
jgi:assimilatory nitrate reductase catalytic subunit